MGLDLNTVDLGAVEALSAIKAEHDQLGERLKTMASKRDQVSAEVYQRVQNDYRRRLDELAIQAAPLKQRAGEAYRTLRTELANLENAFSAARLDREEIDFRHALGEFDAAELAHRVKAVDSRIEEHGKARTQALALKARFLAVVATEAEFEANDDDTARMQAITAQVVASPEASATLIAPPLKTPPVIDSGATMISPAATTATPAAAASNTLPTPPAASPATAAPVIPAAAGAPGPLRTAPRPARNPDATVVFRQGRLEPRNAEAGSVVQTLGLKPISIGADGACDLQLSANGIAKRHVEITMTRAGFSLRDIAASGTVKVNGEVVQERVLAEGDTLFIGPAQFNFRLL